MRKKILTASLVVALAHILAFGFQQGVPWQRFNSPEGKFSVLVPSKPRVQVEEIDAPSGKVNFYRYNYFNNIGLFAVMYLDHPDEPKDAGQRETRLDVTRNGVLKSLGGKLISDKKIRLYGYPGREFTVEKTEPGAEGNYQWRIFLVGKRIYQLTVATERKDSRAPDVAKFFTSFELKK